MVKVKTLLSIIVSNARQGFLSSIKNKFLGYPPAETDLVGYETLLDWVKQHKVDVLNGDVVEIGSFLGGGTAKLARYFGKRNKKVYAVDVFDPCFDHTQSLEGNSMSSLYSQVLKGRNQEDVFKATTRKYPNIVTIKDDSQKVTLPCREICFSFIDGCHDPDYVRNDFHLVWDKTVPGGAVGFHDYGGNLPQTTRTIDELIAYNKNSIKEISQIREKYIILLTKK